MKFKISNLTVKIVLSAVVVSTILIGSFIFFTGKIFYVKRVNIDLVHESGQQYLFSNLQDGLSLRLSPLKGQLIWDVDLENTLQKIESDLRIKAAKVSRILPDQIQVTIEPHLPIASIIGSVSEKIYPVSIDGELLPVVPVADIPDGPILRGQEFIKDKNKRLAAVEIINQLPETGVLSRGHVSEIYFDKKNGYQLLLSPSGSEVYLGFEDFPRRLSQASRVAFYLHKENLSGRIIDARFHKKVVVRLRNAP